MSDGQGWQLFTQKKLAQSPTAKEKSVNKGACNAWTFAMCDLTPILKIDPHTQLVFQIGAFYKLSSFDATGKTPYFLLFKAKNPVSVLATN